MLGTLADLLGNANGQTPLVVLVAGAALMAAAWIGGRVFRSIRRQGSRIGALELRLKSERTRRRQVEQCLREQGFDLPYWPDDPAELHGITARRRSYGVPLRDDAEPYTAEASAVLPPVPPVPSSSAEDLERFARHRR